MNKNLIAALRKHLLALLRTLKRVPQNVFTAWQMNRVLNRFASDVRLGFGIYFPLDGTPHLTVIVNPDSKNDFHPFVANCCAVFGDGKYGYHYIPRFSENYWGFYFKRLSITILDSKSRELGKTEGKRLIRSFWVEGK